MARAELFRESGGALELLPLEPWLDPGNYRFNTAYALGPLGIAAAELGDSAALAAVREHVHALPTQQAGGVLSYPGRGGGVVNLGLGQLRPGARYRCDGPREGEGVADERGQLRLTLALSGAARPPSISRRR